MDVAYNKEILAVSNDKELRLVLIYLRDSVCFDLNFHVNMCADFPRLYKPGAKYLRLPVFI